MKKNGFCLIALVWWRSCLYAFDIRKMNLMSWMLLSKVSMVVLNFSIHIVNLYQNKYRIKSNRLPERDYRNIGAYFVTINVKNRRQVFGAIKNGIMHYSQLWKICHDEILHTWILRENVIIDAFVVMPDHVHVIVIIPNKIIKNDDVWLKSWWSNDLEKSIQTVETPRGASLRDWLSH